MRQAGFAQGGESFMGVPVCDDLAGLRAGAALIGAGMATPYRSTGAASARAPGAIRAAAAALAPLAGCVNFDLGRPGWAEGAVVDCGDLALDPADAAGNRLRIRHAVAAVREAGAVPVLLGGDASVLVPALQGCEAAAAPLALVHLGAGIGWREQWEGERWGAASAVRRGAEMAHVGRILQIGARGPDTARPEDLAAAEARGACIVPAAALRRSGVEAALATLPEGTPVFLALDLGVFDPAAMPAAAPLRAGGLGMGEVLELVQALAGRGRLGGAAVVGLVPGQDIHGEGAALTAQLLAALLGLIAGR